MVYTLYPKAFRKKTLVASQSPYTTLYDHLVKLWYAVPPLPYLRLHPLRIASLQLFDAFLRRHEETEEGMRTAIVDELELDMGFFNLLEGLEDERMILRSP